MFNLSFLSANFENYQPCFWDEDRITDADWVMVDVVDSCVNKVVPHHALIHQISINLSRKSELKMHLMVEIEYLLTLIVLSEFWCGNENILYKSCSNISKYHCHNFSGIWYDSKPECCAWPSKGNQRFVNLWFTKHQAAVPSPLALYCDFESIHLSVKYCAQTERHLVSAKYWLRIVHYIQTLIWVESYKCSLLQSSSRHPNTQNLEKLWNVKPTSALKWNITTGLTGALHTALYDPTMVLTHVHILARKNMIS